MNPSIIITLKGEPCNAREEVVERFREIAKHHFKDYTFWTSTSLPRERVIGMTPRMFPEPTSPTVPLGPNRTRDGREAEVIAVGVKMRNGSGVVALVDTRDRLFKETVCLYGDGRLGPNYEDPGDLVGHLPPEPPKPREIWLCEDPGGLNQRVWDSKQNVGEGRKQTLFREVIE